MNKHRSSFWIFVTPALFAFTMIMVIPFLLGLYYSLTDWDGINPNPSFIGLVNYSEMFTKNPRFIYSIIITFIYSVLNIVLMNAVALFLAVLLTQNLKLENFYRAAFFVPNLIGGLILGYIWQFIFNRAVPNLFESSFYLLAQRNSALLGIVIAGTWQYAGYLMVIYVTALQNIPRSLFEAAMIDGASMWDKFKSITIPMLAPAFTITTFLSLLYSFKQYDVNYSLTLGGPSTLFLGKAINGTELLSMNIINEAFSFNKMATAQAKSVFFFFVVLAFSLMQVYANKKKEVEI